MWLLDVNMPLGKFGIVAHAAEDWGWGGLNLNGALVEAANGFRVVLTHDRLFSEPAARALRRFPEFCVVLVTRAQLRGPEFLNQFRAAWNRGPIHTAAGQLLRWPDA